MCWADESFIILIKNGFKRKSDLSISVVSSVKFTLPVEVFGALSFEFSRARMNPFDPFACSEVF